MSERNVNRHERIRVLHIVHHLEPGGIEMWLLDIARESEHTVDFCCKGSRTGSLSGTANATGAQVFHAPLHVDHMRHILGLRNRLIDGRYDIAHVHTGVYCGVSVYAAQLARVPCVTTFHSNSFAPQAIGRSRLVHNLRTIYGRFSVRYAIRKGQAVSATSSATLDYIAGFANLPRLNRWKVLPLGVAMEENPSVYRDEKLDSLGVAPNSLVITHVGAFREAKNHSTLIKIFANIIKTIGKQGGAVTLLLVGDGPLRETVQRQVQDLGLSNRVAFLGRRMDVAEILNVSDMFLFPSVVEGFGKAVIEASAAGLPVVASNIGGLSEAVVHGETGFLFPVTDLEAMSDCSIKLLRNSQYRREIGDAGRCYVRQKFGISQSISEVEALYTNVLGASKSTTNSTTRTDSL